MSYLNTLSKDAIEGTIKEINYSYTNCNVILENIKTNKRNLLLGSATIYKKNIIYYLLIEFRCPITSFNIQIFPPDDYDTQDFRNKLGKCNCEMYITMSDARINYNVNNNMVTFSNGNYGDGMIQNISIKYEDCKSALNIFTNIKSNLHYHN